MEEQKSEQIKKKKNQNSCLMLQIVKVRIKNKLKNSNTLTNIHWKRHVQTKQTPQKKHVRT